MSHFVTGDRGTHIPLRVLTAGRSRQPRRTLTVCAALTLTSWAVALYALLKTLT